MNSSFAIQISLRKHVKYRLLVNPVMASSLDILDVTSKPRFDDTLTSYKHISHYPLASSTYGYNEEIRFQVENQNDFWLPSQSYITIEGYLNKKPQAVAPNAGSEAVFIHVAPMFHLFADCRYLLNGVEIDRTRGLGIACEMKALCSLTPDDILSYSNVGFGAFSENVNNVTGHHFNVYIPLKLFLGFAEDYNKIILGARQELIFTRARNDRNALFSETPNEASTVNITKMTWVIPSVGVSDRTRISLLNVINKDVPISIPFRTWEYHENPAVPQTTKFTWTITSASQLERPRYVLLAFQTNRHNLYTARNNWFDHVNVTNVKLFLNSESFPYTNLNLDFENSKYGAAYELFRNFQASYYARERPSPNVDYSDFKEKFTVFVIDCSKQNERLKIATTDIRLEVQTSAAIPANTRCGVIV